MSLISDNFTHFRELLEEREHISIGYATLCRMLKGAGITSKRKHWDGGKRFSRPVVPLPSRFPASWCLQRKSRLCRRIVSEEGSRKVLLSEIKER
jgi:hypothetical protein